MDSAGIAVRSLTSIDARAPAEVGTSARLELTFAAQDGRTVLRHSYAEPPFRAGQVFAADGQAHVIMASSAPGIFGGDRLAQTIAVGRGAAVHLRSQSAMQVHPVADGRPALLTASYRVADDAHLGCSWDPVIPFRQSRFQQIIAIDLDDGGTLLWSDAFMCGREARGELWAFDTLRHELRLSRGGRLVYLERYELHPGCADPRTRWTAADARYFGTVLVVDDRLTRQSAADLHDRLRSFADVCSAADCVEEGVVVVRLMAARGVPFHAARDMVQTWCAAVFTSPRSNRTVAAQNR